jgi:hypothetical protein
VGVQGCREVVEAQQRSALAVAQGYKVVGEVVPQSLALVVAQGYKVVVEAVL